MSAKLNRDDLGRRLVSLLVFRALVATALLVLTGVADYYDWPLRLIGGLLYGVVIATYLVVLLLGVLLRSGTAPVILVAAHLATAVLAAFMVVAGTGGVESAFSFLYLLAILDGAIVGGRRVAVAVASGSILAYGTQLALQLYGIYPTHTAAMPPDQIFVSSFVTHLAAFYLMALLSGYLAQLLGKERRTVRDVRADLERAEEVHATVLESLPLGVLTCTGDCTVQTANAAAVRILGQGAPLVGQPLPAALAAFMHGDAATGEVTFDAAGTPRHLSLSRASVALPAPPDNAAPSPLDVLVLEDRTELRALERDLQAKERLASIGKLAAAIAHELRNPLAAISGSVELSSGETTSPEERARLQRIILREIERLDQLVADFLAYAQPAQPQRTAVDVVALARQVCDSLRQDPRWAHHEVRVDAPDRLQTEVDAGQIRRLLHTLLRNAIDASPEAAPVDLRIFTGDGREAPAVLFEVHDRGPGLTADVVEHLFEPFHTTKKDATGLGLAVAHRIVMGHGGTIHFDSAPRAGTVVRVELPWAH